MNLYTEQFYESHDFSSSVATSKVLIIASTGRSGSHMLGHSLYETKQFGFPLEYANPLNLVQWKKRFSENDLMGVIKKIQNCRTSTNGVFSIKIHYSHVKEFGGFENIINFFPNAYFVHVARGNVLHQAISMARAAQTGVWISGQKPKNIHPKYNYKLIDRFMREIILDNASWKYALEANGCEYIEVDFKDIKNDMENSIRKIAEFSGIELDCECLPKSPVTISQSDSLNYEWEKMFLAEFNHKELINKTILFDVMKKYFKKNS